jgi:hypothetical protein
MLENLERINIKGLLDSFGKKSFKMSHAPNCVKLREENEKQTEENPTGKTVQEYLKNLLSLR